MKLAARVQAICSAPGSRLARSLLEHVGGRLPRAVAELFRSQLLVTRTYAGTSSIITRTHDGIDGGSAILPSMKFPIYLGSTLEADAF